MRSLAQVLVAAFALTIGLSAAAAPARRVDPALAAVIAGAHRSPEFIARDPARHPAEELAFFGLKPSMTVVELWPGGGYWTEMLAPYLAARGHYTVALPLSGDAEESPAVTRWRARLAAHPELYDKITETTLGPAHYEIAPPASADLVLTFRNLHNWMGGGYASEALAACFRALKPGGILGIEAHRGRSDVPQDPKGASGYVREDYAIGLARQAGFELVGASEINANPKDTKDWPDGVWTLPPTLTLGDKDRAKYVAIGEADNFVLRFRKPPQLPARAGLARDCLPDGHALACAGSLDPLARHL
jgi:predicted methyltransferase